MSTFEEISGFLECLGDAIIIVDKSSSILFANRACIDLFGYTNQDMRDLTISDLMGKSVKLKHPDLVHKFINSKARARTMMTRASMPCINATGKPFNARISISTVTIDNQSYGIATIQDFTSLQKEIEHLEVTSHQDILTGLYNRRYLQQITEQNSRILDAWHDIGVIFIDLDQFKPVNDHYGHEVGDAILKVVSNKIKGCVRFDDIVFRLGGDEFVILMNLTEITDKRATLKTICEKIHHEVSRPIKTHEHEIIIGLSAGCGLYPENSASLKELINLADKAMYSSKKSGQTVTFIE